MHRAFVGIFPGNTNCQIGEVVVIEISGCQSRAEFIAPRKN
jgi:hypothetical protein